MKALVCTRPGKLAYITVDKPELSQDRGIIRIKRVGVCGTDLHAFEGTQPYFHYPRILGHELSGELVEFDNAPGFEKGESVSFIPYYNCGRCIACRNGKTNCCTQMQVCGVHVDGGMVEYLSVPSSSLLHSEGLSFDELALAEPLAIGAHGIRKAAVKPGEYVLVMGAGPIGLGVMEFARIAGGKVIALDINKERLRFCENKLQVVDTIDASTDDIIAKLMDATNNDMPTVVIDATGNLKAINNAFNYMAHGARYILIGLQKENISFSHPEFHKKEATLMSSRNATRQDFEYVVANIKNGVVNPTTYITQRVQFDNVLEKFESWLDPASGLIKAMIEIQ